MGGYEWCVATCQGNVTLDIHLNPLNGYVLSTSEVRFTAGSYVCDCLEGDPYQGEDAEFDFDDQGNIACEVNEKDIELGYSGGFNLLASMPVIFYCNHDLCSDGSAPWPPLHECIGGGTLPDTTKVLPDHVYEIDEFNNPVSPGHAPGKAWDECMKFAGGIGASVSIGRFLLCLQKKAPGPAGEAMIKRLLRGIVCRLFGSFNGANPGEFHEELCGHTDCGEPQLPDNDGEINL
tara:strand:+ start:705 stop:1406 length:702 start_codon:yes stop_codon:yes gene_type:complete